MSDDAMSCADMGQLIMHSEPVQMIAGEIGAGVTVFGPGKGPLGVLANIDLGQSAADLFPWAAGAVTYGACLPAELGIEGGAAIGQSLLDTGHAIQEFFGLAPSLGAPAAPTPSPDAFATLASADFGGHGHHADSSGGHDSSGSHSGHGASHEDHGGSHGSSPSGDM